ncbi:hypothetical protein ACJX0J_006091, partial [Zea mays]
TIHYPVVFSSYNPIDLRANQSTKLVENDFPGLKQTHLEAQNGTFSTERVREDMINNFLRLIMFASNNFRKSSIPYVIKMIGYIGTLDKLGRELKDDLAIDTSFGINISSNQSWMDVCVSIGARVVCCSIYYYDIFYFHFLLVNVLYSIEKTPYDILCQTETKGYYFYNKTEGKMSTRKHNITQNASIVRLVFGLNHMVLSCYARVLEDLKMEGAYPICYSQGV